MDTLPAVKKPSNRRSSMRKPARKSIRLQCRRGSMGLGANIAFAFVDISESGVQLYARDPLKLGQEVEVILEGYGMHTAIRRIGEVRWTSPHEAGGFRVGVRFSKFVSFREVQLLAAP